jgi:hypothetical protein
MYITPEIISVALGIAGFYWFNLKIRGVFRNPINAIALLVVSWMVINPHDWYLTFLEDLKRSSFDNYHVFMRGLLWIAISYSGATFLLSIRQKRRIKRLGVIRKVVFTLMMLGMSAGVLILFFVLAVEYAWIDFEL